MAKDLLKIDQKNIMKKAFEGIKDEILKDNIEMIRDYVKGLYWYKRDIEKQIAELTKLTKDIDEAVELVESGDMEKAKEIKVPVKYLSEKTVRLNDIDWTAQE